MSIIDSPFETGARPLDASMARYGALYKKLKKEGLSADERQEFSAVRAILDACLELVCVTPDPGNSDLHAQLAGQDRVHPGFGADSVEGLLAYRLGCEGDTKTAYALITPGPAGERKILSAIYACWTDGFPGSVHGILHSRVSSLRSSPSDAVFYTISSIGGMAGAGEMLIERLYANLNARLPAGVTLSTFSPLRTLRHWAQEQGASDPDTLDDADLSLLALRRLDHARARDQDIVQRFHMGNGAEIFQILLHANAAGSPDVKEGAGVMVRYVYPRDESRLLRNRDILYPQGQIRQLMSPALRGRLEAPQTDAFRPAAGPEPIPAGL